MESLKIVTSITFLILSVIVIAQEVKYASETFVNIHQNASRYSQVLATISCNHPLMIIKDVKDGTELVENISEKWQKIKTGEYVGYIFDAYVSSKKVNCLQDLNPKFFEKLNLTLTDMYYWARLNDMYIIDKTQVQ